eukprot:gb/GEZN01004708.1/.p1 GENE.gb/GEZN01004708.1/~~gb/GEZN01004708.1/.p1  ORF type:complete len:536 (-),score=99.76 gb/GEZN01004708.1/:223-1830(-)
MSELETKRSPPPSLPTGKTPDVKFQDCKVIKYGRKGKPHARVLYLDMNPGGHPSFTWCKQEDRGKKTKLNYQNSVEVRDVADVRRGKDTEVFKRKQAVETNDETCVSIITARRTLDLVVEDKGKRDELADAIAEVYNQVCQRPLLLGIRVRRDSTYADRLEFEQKVHDYLRLLHSKNLEIWDKSMKELPSHNVDKDFPRLAKNFVIFHVYPVQQAEAKTINYEGEDQDSDSDSEDTGRIRHSKKPRADGDAISIDTLSMVPNLGQAYETRRLDTCDYEKDAIHNCRTVMAAFACLLLAEEPATDLMEDFIEKTEACLDETKKVDIQRILREFLDKQFANAGTEEPTQDGNNRRAFLALLKVCNQNIIFPSVYLLKQTVLDPFRARDLHEKGGWDIVVSFHPKHVYITHSRREISDGGRFSYQWTLTLTFEFPSFDLMDSSLQVTELRFLADASDHVRHDLSTKLFQVNRIGAMIQRERMAEAAAAAAKQEKGNNRRTTGLVRKHSSGSGLNGSGVAKATSLSKDGSIRHGSHGAA